LSRDPSGKELTETVAFLQKQRTHHGSKADPAVSALTDLTHVLFNLNEFVYVP
jgi:hypothetical protein